MRKKKAIQAIEQQILEEHAELHYDEEQHSRAYHSGLMDGLGFALKMLKPTSSVISLTTVWFEDEPTQTLERGRERSIEVQWVDLDDEPAVGCMAGLFDTAEAE